jgi:UDP-galactopyranose mutase
MYLIVGCGLSGATIAERIANVLNKKVVIIDKRDHIGGNCYDYKDKDTNILMCKYGAHLFKTNDEKIWNYINMFSEWVRWEHTVLSYVDNKFVSVPVNITTVNVLCNETLQTTDDMNEWLKKNQVEYDSINNSEEMCKSIVGELLYNKMFSNYTYKQWNKYPSELDASVLARIPIRKSFDTRYFDHKYQVLPKNGYTAFVEKMLDNPNITVKLNCDFELFKQNNNNDLSMFEKIIFTGPVDEYFNSVGLNKLEYRSLNFEIKKYENMNYYQPASVVNYPELNVPFTRIVEYKHFLNQTSKDTVIVIETSTDKGEPYYPVPTKSNLSLYEKYKKLALAEETSKNVFFVGRLANYKYFNMDETIHNALVFFETKLLN